MAVEWWDGAFQYGASASQALQGSRSLHTSIAQAPPPPIIHRFRPTLFLNGYLHNRKYRAHSAQNARYF
jgi:hypothetical protein